MPQIGVCQQQLTGRIHIQFEHCVTCITIINYLYNYADLARLENPGHPHICALASSFVHVRIDIIYGPAAVQCFIQRGGGGGGGGGGGRNFPPNPPKLQDPQLLSSTSKCSF